MEYITIPSDPLFAQQKIHILHRRAQQDPIFVMLTRIPEMHSPGVGIEKWLLQKILSFKGLFLKRFIG